MCLTYLKLNLPGQKATKQLEVEQPPKGCGCSAITVAIKLMRLN